MGYLVINRKQNERVYFFIDDIKIVVRLDWAIPGRANLAIEAPPEVVIKREELLEDSQEGSR